MNKKTIEELHASVRDGGAILRGKMKPARRTVITGPEVAAIRKNMELSQAACARMMGISVDTLPNWEQERRTRPGIVDGGCENSRGGKSRIAGRASEDHDH
jgi:putative transcriptional regulator